MCLGTLLIGVFTACFVGHLGASDAFLAGCVILTISGLVLIGLLGNNDEGLKSDKERKDDN